MLVESLGAVDVFAGLLLVLSGFNFIIPLNLLLIFGLILLLKSTLGFYQEFGSWIDLVSAVVMIFSYLFFDLSFVNIIVGLAIIQKGAVSFI